LGRADFFVSKLDKNGYYQWTYLAGQKSNYMAAARIKAKGGIVYVVGKDKTYNSILLTKLNSGTGTKTGETSWSSTNFPYLAPTGIAIDSTGGIAVSAVGSIFKFGTNGNKLSDYFLLRSLISGRSIFPSIPESFTIIQKFDSTLSPVWTYTQGLFGNNGPFAIAFDVNNNIYFGGEYMGDLVYSVYDSRGSVGGSTDVNLVKLNSLGQFQWAETIGGYGRDRLQSIVVDGNNIFIGGFFSGGMDGNITHSPRQYISSHGAEDGFVGKYSGITAP